MLGPKLSRVAFDEIWGGGGVKEKSRRIDL